VSTRVLGTPSGGGALNFRETTARGSQTSRAPKGGQHQREALLEGKHIFPQKKKKGKFQKTLSGGEKKHPH